jgi:uncharacterized membrane protein
MTFTVVFALAAAFSNAVNLMTQHSASAGAPEREKGWRLVAYLFRQPLWLLGWIAAVGGFAFQAVALHYGQLSVVQPILVTELVFVLVLRRVWIRQDVARAAWTAVLVVCGALAVFLAVAEPTGGHLTPETAEWLSALLAFGGAIAGLGVLGRRGCSPPPDRSPRERCPRRASALAASHPGGLHVSPGSMFQEHAKRRVARRRGTCDRVEGRRWQRDAADSCGRRAGR